MAAIYATGSSHTEEFAWRWSQFFKWKWKRFS